MKTTAIPTHHAKLGEIDRHAKRYAAARARLSARFAKFNRALAALQEKHLGKIKDALDDAATVQSRLETALSAAPELFKDPRTLTLHGVRVGFMEGKPSITLPTARAKQEAVVAAIRARFTAEEIERERLIVPVETPVAAALLERFKADKELALAGVEFSPGGDRVFIKPADHALDKVIRSLLKEGLKKGTPATADSEQEEDAA